MGFVQIIEYRTSRHDEVDALSKEWDEASQDTDISVRVLECADRDRPGTYLTIVEFPTYEAAMENSNRPETTTFAERMAKLCEGEPIFRNLDVLREDHTG